MAAGALALVGGCAPRGTIALSPDGQSVASVWPMGNEVKLAVGSRTGADWKPVSDVNIDGGLSWSPDSRWLGAQTSSGVRLFDTRLGRFRGSFGPVSTFPLAWRPDAAQVAYIARDPEPAGASLVTYSLGDQRETGRTGLGKIDPAAAVWLPRSDGQALLDSGGNVHVVEQGEARQVSRTGDVIGLGLSADGRELIWARIGQVPRQTLMTVWAYHLERRSVRRVAFADRVPGTLDASGAAPRGLRVFFAPGADRMVLVAEYGSQRSRALAVSGDGRTARELTTARGFLDVAWAADGSRFGLMALEQRNLRVSTYAPDGSEGKVVGSKVWRDRPQ